MQVTCYSDDVIHAQRTHDGIVHRSLNLHPVCAVNVLLVNEQILDHFFPTVVLASNNLKKL